MCLLVCIPLCGRVPGEDQPAAAERAEVSDIAALLEQTSAGTDPDFEALKKRVGLVPEAIAPRDFRTVLTGHGVEFRSLGLDLRFRDNELQLMWTSTGRTELSVDDAKRRVDKQLESVGLERVPDKPDTLFPLTRFRRVRPSSEVLVISHVSRAEGEPETTVVIQWHDTSPSRRNRLPLKEVLREVPALRAALQQVDFLKLLEEKAVREVSSTFADPRLPDLYRRSLLYMPNGFSIAVEEDASALLRNVLPRMKYQMLERSPGSQGRHGSERWERRRDRYAITLFPNGWEPMQEWIEISGVRRLGQLAKPQPAAGP